MSTESTQVKYPEAIRDECLTDVMNFEKALARILVRLLRHPGQPAEDGESESDKDGKGDRACGA